MLEANASERSQFQSSSAPATTSRQSSSPDEKRERFVSPEWLVGYLVRNFDIEITVKTLANWRSGGKGPRYISIAGRVRYDVRDIGRWLIGQRRGQQP
jgi:hypothetical protein